MSSKCPLLPCGNYCVLLPEAPASNSKIVLLHDDNKQKARVIAVGPDAEELRGGERVLYEKLKATIVEIAGTKWMLLKESNVLCTLG